MSLNITSFIYGIISIPTNVVYFFLSRLYRWYTSASRIFHFALVLNRLGHPLLLRPLCMQPRTALRRLTLHQKVRGHSHINSQSPGQTPLTATHESFATLERGMFDGSLKKTHISPLDGIHQDVGTTLIAFHSSNLSDLHIENSSMYRTDCVLISSFLNSHHLLPQSVTYNNNTQSKHVLRGIGRLLRLPAHF